MDRPGRTYLRAAAVFEVAIVLLISVAFSMARHTGTNLVKLVIPLFAGVAAAAAFLLLGPAPMLLASQMHADFGWMILIGLCAAIRDDYRRTAVG